MYKNCEKEIIKSLTAVYNKIVEEENYQNNRDTQK